ncbi:MAG: hypothetical protein ACREL2_06240 [Gemmatimonadales bacterium]
MCQGNMCRSPFAAGVLRRALAALDIDVLSAGFQGGGRESPAPAVVAAGRRRVDLRGHRSQPLTTGVARSVDLVLVMDERQRRAVCDLFGGDPSSVIVLGDLDPASIDSRAIRDPINQPSRVYDEVYARIERCARELVQVVRYRGAA